MQVLLYIVGIPYMIGVVIFGLYYNYLYAQENGFIAWLFFGEIIATFKSFFWPLIEFNII